jgi:hypothetical protein
MTLLRQDLDAATCDEPGCSVSDQHLVLTLQARCHDALGVVVAYDKRRGALAFACPCCHAFLAEIAVADRPAIPPPALH